LARQGNPGNCQAVGWTPETESSTRRLGIRVRFRCGVRWKPIGLAERVSERRRLRAAEARRGEEKTFSRRGLASARIPEAGVRIRRPEMMDVPFV